MAMDPGRGPPRETEAAFYGLLSDAEYEALLERLEAEVYEEREEGEGEYYGEEEEEGQAGRGGMGEPDGEEWLGPEADDDPPPQLQPHQQPQHRCICPSCQLGHLTLDHHSGRLTCGAGCGFALPGLDGVGVPLTLERLRCRLEVRRRRPLLPSAFRSHHA